jgi:uroporphyrinogen decarboxylase
MTPKERMATALNLGIPDRVPTFELEFQLSEELMGKPFLRESDMKNDSPKEQERKIAENAEYLIQVYERLEHDAICIQYLNEEHAKQTIRRIRALTGDRYMLLAHGDGTFAIPDGDGMLDFAYRIADEPESVHEEAERMCQNAIDYDLRMLDAGLDGFILCSDYCFNKGPFLSPKMFGEFVTPYLTRLIAAIRSHGGYAIKHTDGNIMPILDQLVAANPHALHSIDPMAGVDIREVKRLVGDKVALCGNVHCAAMQTGTDEEVIASAEYCLTYAKPGGGYVFCTSNIPFKGLPLQRYLMVLDVWKRMRDY